MKYDLFISYARADNTEGRISQLKTLIEDEYFDFTEEKLNVFFDQTEIHTMEDWVHRIEQELRNSHLFLLVLSPNYQKSKYCNWEIVEYLKYEYARGIQGNGVAQVYYIEVPGIDNHENKEDAARWIKKISSRHRVDLREWSKDGLESIKQLDVRKRLDDLKSSLKSSIHRKKLLDVASSFGNMPAPNARFVGRTREMQNVHSSVGNNKLGVITAVHGIGGLGKTSLAIQYAFAYADHYPGGRWLIHCSGISSLASAIIMLRDDLNILLADEQRRNPVQGAKRILNELERRAVENSSRFNKEPAVLLIFDNADNRELFSAEEIALVSGKSWLKILVTTRMGDKELGNDPNRIKLIPIDHLPEEDAVSLIASVQPSEQFSNDTERKSAVEIVRFFGGFTLAVEVTALYIQDKQGKVTCSDFLDMIKRKGTLSAEEFAAKNNPKEIIHTKLISATFEPTYDLLSAIERLIVQYASLLPPDMIPLPWIRSMVALVFPEAAEDALLGEIDTWDDAVDHLLSLRVLQAIEDNEAKDRPRIVRMHRLLGEFIKSRSENPESLQAALFVHSLERSSFLRENWYIKQYQWEIKPLVSYLYLLLENEFPAAIKLTNSIEAWLRNIWDMKTAKELLDFSLEFSNKLEYIESSETALLHTHLGSIQQKLGALSIAEQLQNKALSIFESKPVTDYLNYTTILSNNGRIKKALGKYKEARDHYNHAIHISKNYLSAEHEHLSRDYNNLASLEKASGSLELAKELYLLALKIDIRRYPQNHPTLAIRYNNIATVERALGNYEDARRLYKKAIEIDVEALPQDHPTLAIRYNNLGRVEKALGNFLDARQFYTQALEIDKKAYNPDHPSIAIRLCNLGQVEKSLGNLIDARQYTQRAIEIGEVNTPHDLKRLITRYNNLANIEYLLGNTKAAKDNEAKAQKLLNALQRDQL